MSMQEIISLEEYPKGFWKAKYQGNYGIYTIKIKMGKGKMDSFSCSCPSDYYPCKHIPMIKKAIEKKVSKSKSSELNDTESIENMINKISATELRKFIIDYAQCKPDFANAVQLEFLHTIKENTSEKDRNSIGSYSKILRKELKKYQFDYEDLYDYHDSCFEIEVLDDWLMKVKSCVEQNQIDEAVAICKAIIEEYAEWMSNTDEEVVEYVDLKYIEEPFEILIDIANKNPSYADSLFDYSFDEVKKDKYKENDVEAYWLGLLLKLANNTDQLQRLLTLHDECLKSLSDNSSYQAQKLIEQKINILERLQQPEKAEQLLMDNIQIGAFREKVVKMRIREKKYSEAKKLIKDFLSSDEKSGHYSNHNWNTLLLTIAQKEKDIPTIRKISFSFIGNYFNAEYYRIYKSTFEPDQWPTELQKLLKLYKKNWGPFDDSVAKVFLAEKDIDSLFNHIAENPTIRIIENYYTYILSKYPKETLALFRKAIDQHAEHNTGRDSYATIKTLLEKMKKMDGGSELVKLMLEQYRSKYKNRRAMMEVLNIK